MTMLHSQLAMINGLLNSNTGNNLDYHNQLAGVFNHLNASLEYVRNNHFDIVSQYNGLIRYVLDSMRSIISSIDSGRTSSNDVITYFTGHPMNTLSDIANQIENILSELDPTYAAV